MIWGLMSPRFRSKIALFLTPVYFLTNVALGSIAESNIWADRRSAPSLKSTTIDPLPLRRPGTLLAGTPLPLKNDFDLSSYGSIRKIIPPASGKTGPTVLHIQDVHMNADAQLNIGRAIQTLIDKDRVEAVALEGGFGPLDFAAFRAFPHRSIIAKVADGLLAENIIAGPVHTALSSEREIPPFFGVDDRAHYDANVAAYKAAVPVLDREKQAWLSEKKSLEAEKARRFHPALLAFDRLVGSYRGGQSTMGSYLHALARTQPLSRNCQTFLDALSIEARLDFKAVEGERSRLVEKLLPVFTTAQKSTFINSVAAFRAGQINDADFYRSLKTLGATAGLPPSQFPALFGYIDYVELSQKIDAELLFTEMRDLERAAYERLATTDHERRLIAASRRHTLTGKLLDFALTSEEWREYSKRDNKGNAFNAFYEQAEARDEKMADNLLKIALRPADREKVYVLVTGGFHSRGIERRLAEAGCKVVSFVPKISKVETENGAAYLSAFTQEKTPLEKIFQGDTLFLAQEAFPKTVERMAATNAVISATSAGFRLEALEAFKRIILGGGNGVVWALGMLKFVFVVVVTKSRLTLIWSRPDRTDPESIAVVSAQVPHSILYNGALFLISTINFLFLGRGFRPHGWEDNHRLKVVGLLGAVVESILIVFLMTSASGEIYTPVLLLLAFFFADYLIGSAVSPVNSLPIYLRPVSLTRLTLLTATYAVFTSFISLNFLSLWQAIGIAFLVGLPHVVIDAVLLWLPQIIGSVTGIQPLKEETVSPSTRIEGLRRRLDKFLLKGPNYNRTDTSEVVPMTREDFRYQLKESVATVRFFYEEILSSSLSQAGEKRLSISDAERRKNELKEIEPFLDVCSANLEKVLEKVRQFYPDILSKLEAGPKPVSIVAVATKTRLLTSNPFSSEFFWGTMDVDVEEGRRVILLSMRHLSSLQTDDEFKMAAFSIVAGVKLIENFYLIKNKDSKSVHADLVKFRAKLKIESKPFVPKGYFMRHVWNCLHDMRTLHKLRSEIHRELNRIMNVGFFDYYTKGHVGGRKIERWVEDIVSNPANFVSGTNVLQRAGDLVWRNQEKRDPTIMIQNALIDLAQRSMAIGEYGLATRILHWGRMVFVFDSAELPYSNYVLLLKVLTRTRRYAELRRELVNINRGQLVIYVPWTFRRFKNGLAAIWAERRQLTIGTVWQSFRERIRTRIVLQFSPNEKEFLLTAIENQKLDNWIGRTLTIHARMTPNESDRKMMVRERHMDSTLIRQFRATQIIGKTFGKIKADSESVSDSASDSVMARMILSELNKLPNSVFPVLRELITEAQKNSLWNLLAKINKEEPALWLEGMTMMTERDLLPERAKGPQMLRRKLWALRYAKRIFPADNEEAINQLIVTVERLIRDKVRFDRQDLTGGKTMESAVDSDIILKTELATENVYPSRFGPRNYLSLPSHFINLDIFEIAMRAAYGRHMDGLDNLTSDDPYRALALAWFKFVYALNEETKKSGRLQTLFGQDPWFQEDRYISWERIRMWFMQVEGRLNARLQTSTKDYLYFVTQILEPARKEMEKAAREIEANTGQRLLLPKRILYKPGQTDSDANQTAAMAGSSTGHFILDPLLREWKYFLAGPFVSVVTAALLSWFGFTSPASDLLAISVVVGTMAWLLLFASHQKWFVRSHKQAALNAVKEVLKEFGKPELSPEEHRSKLRFVYLKLSVPVMPIFLGSVMICSHTLPGLDPVALAVLGFLITWAVHTLYHIVYNLLFKFGYFRWAKVPGATAEGKKKFKTLTKSARHLDEFFSSKIWRNNPFIRVYVVAERDGQVVARYFDDVTDQIQAIQAHVNWIQDAVPLHRNFRYDYVIADGDSRLLADRLDVTLDQIKSLCQKMRVPEVSGEPPITRNLLRHRRDLTWAYIWAGGDLDFLDRMLRQRTSPAELLNGMHDVLPYGEGESAKKAFLAEDAVLKISTDPRVLEELRKREQAIIDYLRDPDSVSPTDTIRYGIRYDSRLEKWDAHRESLKKALGKEVPLPQIAKSLGLSLEQFQGQAKAYKLGTLMKSIESMWVCVRSGVLAGSPSLDISEAALATGLDEMEIRKQFDEISFHFGDLVERIGVSYHSLLKEFVKEKRNLEFIDDDPTEWPTYWYGFLGNPEIRFKIDPRRARGALIAQVLACGAQPARLADIYQVSAYQALRLMRLVADDRRVQETMFSRARLVDLYVRYGGDLAQIVRKEKEGTLASLRAALKAHAIPGDPLVRVRLKTRERQREVLIHQLRARWQSGEAMDTAIARTFGDFSKERFSFEDDRVVLAVFKSMRLQDAFIKSGDNLKRAAEYLRVTIGEAELLRSRFSKQESDFIEEFLKAERKKLLDDIHLAKGDFFRLARNRNQSIEVLGELISVHHLEQLLAGPSAVPLSPKVQKAREIAALEDALRKNDFDVEAVARLRNVAVKEVFLEIGVLGLNKDLIRRVKSRYELKGLIHQHKGNLAAVASVTGQLEAVVRVEYENSGLLKDEEIARLVNEHDRKPIATPRSLPESERGRVRLIPEAENPKERLRPIPEEYDGSSVDAVRRWLSGDERAGNDVLTSLAELIRSYAQRAQHLQRIMAQLIAPKVVSETLPWEDALEDLIAEANVAVLTALKDSSSSDAHSLNVRARQDARRAIYQYIAAQWGQPASEMVLYLDALEQVLSMSTVAEPESWFDLPIDFMLPELEKILPDLSEHLAAWRGSTVAPFSTVIDVSSLLEAQDPKHSPDSEAAKNEDPSLSHELARALYTSLSYPRNFTAIHLYYGLDGEAPESPREIGARFGVSDQTIRVDIQETLGKLRLTAWDSPSLAGLRSFVPPSSLGYLIGLLFGFKPNAKLKWYALWSVIFVEAPVVMALFRAVGPEWAVALVINIVILHMALYAAVAGKYRINDTDFLFMTSTVSHVVIFSLYWVAVFLGLPVYWPVAIHVIWDSICFWLLPKGDKTRNQQQIEKILRSDSLARDRVLALLPESDWSTFINNYERFASLTHSGAIKIDPSMKPYTRAIVGRLAFEFTFLDERPIENDIRLFWPATSANDQAISMKARRFAQYYLRNSLGLPELSATRGLESADYVQEYLYVWAMNPEGRLSPPTPPAPHSPLASKWAYTALSRIQWWHDTKRVPKNEIRSLVRAYARKFALADSDPSLKADLRDTFRLEAILMMLGEVGGVTSSRHPADAIALINAISDSLNFPELLSRHPTENSTSLLDWLTAKTSETPETHMKSFRKILAGMFADVGNTLDRAEEVINTVVLNSEKPEEILQKARVHDWSWQVLFSPLLQELLFTVVPLYFWGVPGLLLSRLFFVALHMTGPPGNIRLRWLAPLLISSIPFLFGVDASTLEWFIRFSIIHVLINGTFDKINEFIKIFYSDFQLGLGMLDVNPPMKESASDRLELVVERLMPEIRNDLESDLSGRSPENPASTIAPGPLPHLKDLKRAAREVLKAA